MNKKLFLNIVLIIAALGIIACQSGNSTPTGAVKLLIKAVKEKDVKAYKSVMPKAKLQEQEEYAKKNNKNYDDDLKLMLENRKVGQDETIEVLNEKIDGSRATVEIKTPKSDDPETIKLIKEDDGWKIGNL